MLIFPSPQLVGYMTRTTHTQDGDSSLPCQGSLDRCFILVPFANCVTNLSRYGRVGGGAHMVDSRVGLHVRSRHKCLHSERCVFMTSKQKTHNQGKCIPPPGTRSKLKSPGKMCKFIHAIVACECHVVFSVVMTISGEVEARVGACVCLYVSVNALVT